MMATQTSGPGSGPARASTPRPASRLAPAASLALALVTSACAGLGAASPPDECELTVSYTPDLLEASPTEMIRATATLRNVSGLPSYSWEILHGSAQVSFTPANPESSQIDFLAPVAGVYQVRLTVQSSSQCPSYAQNLNVLQPGVSLRTFRLRVTPPASSADAAPQDLTMTVPRGSDFASTASTLSPALPLAGTVRSGGVAVPAYVRFSLSGTAGEPVAETVSSSQGAFTARLGFDLYDVLVVPTGDQAPFAITRWDPSSQLLAGPGGVTVSGEVRDPGGAALAGARVSLRAGAVSSTVATTGGDGAFTLRAQPGTGVEYLVEPPAGSGLPRLRGATTASLDPGQPLLIRYSATLSRRDLGGLLLQRQGVAAPGAAVTFVGDLPAAGNAGAVSLSGAVRITAIAGGDGRLPSTSVPQAALSAVVQPAPGELAVVPFNAAAAPPAALDTPAMRQLSGTVVTPGAAAAAPGALVELIPQGALAQAGVPASSLVAGAGGAFSAAAAPGGLYRVAITDPLGRGSRAVTAVTAPRPLGALPLALGWKVTGKLLPALASSPVRGAAVQLYCGSCTGVAQPDRPFSEGVTGDDGTFTLVAPDELTSANGAAP